MASESVPEPRPLYGAHRPHLKSRIVTEGSRIILGRRELVGLLLVLALLLANVLIWSVGFSR